MRVIAGSARGLLLDTPKGMKTRPTSDRIKETLFNILQNDLYGARFLDLFAGSGQMGIEALSRGAKDCIFVDNDKNALLCIQRNVEHTGFLDRSLIKNQRAEDAILSLAGDPMDIVFMEPPYHEGMEENLLRSLSSSPLITEDTRIILEADLKTALPFAEELGFTITRVKTYKTNQHYFLRKN